MRVKLILIFSILAFSTFAEECNYPNSPETKTAMDECNQVPGSEWSCVTNRCATTEQAVQLHCLYVANLVE